MLNGIIIQWNDIIMANWSLQAKPARDQSKAIRRNKIEKKSWPSSQRLKSGCIRK